MELIANETNEKSEKGVKNRESFDLGKNLLSLSTKNYIEKDNVLNKNKICLASFPRSGNTMLRTIFENITETYTGDDMVIDPKEIDNYTVFDPNEIENLGAMGLGKEGIVDEKVYLVKTHFPFSYYPTNEFIAEGAVLIVRNPFDSFESLFVFSITGSHFKNISEEEFKEKYSLWEDFLNKCIGWYKHFYEYWLSQKKIPIFMTKYEDFLLNKEKYSMELFNFIDSFHPNKSYLGGLTNKEIHAKIKDTNAVRDTAYIPRKGSNFHSIINNRYTEKQIEKIIDDLWDILEYFDYLKDLENLNIELINKIIQTVISKKENRMIESEKNNSPNKKNTNVNKFSKNRNESDLENISDELESKKVLIINDKENIILNSHFDELLEYWL